MCYEAYWKDIMKYNNNIAESKKFNKKTKNTQ